MILSTEQISKLEQIARSVAEEDHFTVDELFIREDGYVSIELSAKYYVDQGESYDRLISEYLEPNGISERDDILEYLYEHLYEDFAEDYKFNINDFKLKSEEVFEEFLVADFRQFIEDLEVIVQVKLDDVADRVVEEMEEMRQR